MNKHIIWLFTLLVFVLAGCEKDEIGNTATEALAGEWKVTVDAVDEGGNVIAEDFNGIGHILMNTYNTAANTPTEMYVDDIGHFWEDKVRVKSDSIVYYISFSDDEPGMRYKVSGYRYTGLAVDD